MLLIVSQAMLVLLVGVYAMRATSVLFVRQAFHPLMILAAAAFVFALVLFHRPPSAVGTWLYVSIAACVLGAIVNAILYFAPDRTHATPTNLAFSASTGIAWAVLAGVYGAII
jgi:hypothetical protein